MHLDSSGRDLEIQALMYDTARRENCAHALLHMETGEGRAVCTHLIDANTGAPMSPAEPVCHTPFRIHSITKLFVSALILRLNEEGLLALDASLTQLLPPEWSTGLSIWEGRDLSSQLSIRHLAHHTSGLRDYFEDDHSFMGLFPKFYGWMLANPHRLWQGQDIMAYYRQHFLPLAPPGTRFHYSDTNFVLLGLIAEHVTGKPLHTLLQDWIVDPLKLTHTWMEFRTPAPTPKLTILPVQHRSFDYTTLRSSTADWAGGGLASSAADLVILLQAMLEGDRLFKQETSHATLLDFSQERTYGFGIERRCMNKHYHLIGHSGFNNSFVYYCAALNLYMAGVFNQSQFDLTLFLETLVESFLRPPMSHA